MSFDDEVARRSDVRRVENSVTKAHQRIDTLTGDFATMRADVHEIKGCVGPLCDNVQAITNAIVERGINGVPDSSGSIVLLKIVDLMKWLAVASVIGGVISAVGYYGIKAAGKAGDKELIIEKSNSSESSN